MSARKITGRDPGYATMVNKKGKGVSGKEYTMQWKNRIIGNGEEKPDQLLANPKNWRIHPKNQQEALKGVLSKVGWVQDVIVNKNTGFVVDGHLRVTLAMRDGQKTIPVKYVDLTEQEEALILATIDPLSAMASEDEDKLNILVDELKNDYEELLKQTGSLSDSEFDIDLFELPDGDIDQTESMKKFTVFVFKSDYRSFMAELKSIMEKYVGCRIV